MDHGSLAIRKRDWLESDYLYLDYLYLVLIGCRMNNFIITVKCQSVVKCEHTCFADVRCVKNFSEYNNCVASFGTAKRKIKIVRINLKSTFLVYNADDVGKVFTRTCQKFQK